MEDDYDSNNDMNQRGSNNDMKDRDWFKPKQERQHLEEKPFTEITVDADDGQTEQQRFATVNMAPVMKKRRTVPYVVNDSGNKRFVSSPRQQPQPQRHQLPHHKPPRNPLHNFYHQNLKDIKREHDQLLMLYS